MSKDQSEYLINRNNKQYEVIIGLEVHAQVLSKSKLFSTSATKFGAEPNTQVSLVDAAFPGMLPVINEFCVKQAIKTGIGLNAKINKTPDTKYKIADKFADINYLSFFFFLYIASILWVTKNPPKILTAAKIIAKNP